MPAILGKMNRIGRCAGIFRSTRLEGEELTPRQHSFVLCICQHPGLSQDQIARRLCLNKSTVTRILTQLEDKGYVVRCVSAVDKRMTEVYPSEKMTSLYPTVRAITDEWNQALAEGLTPEETALFLRVLDRMEARAKELTGIDDKEEGNGVK